MALAASCSLVLPPQIRGVSRKSARNTGHRAVTYRATMAFERDWLKKNPIVPVLGFVGWTVPSSIPVGAYGGKSLFSALVERIGENISHFPTPPALDDPFWLYMVTWHIGLFITLLLGQVGVNGKKQGYW